MKFVVISDLHTGTATIAQDFCVGDSTSAVKKGYMDDLRKLVEREDLEADYLIVTGDITNRSMYDEFELAAKRIKECAETFNIEESNIFFVPGNHDSNWKDEEASRKNNEPDSLVIASKYKFISSHPFFKSILKNSREGCFYNEPYFAFWSDDKVNVIGVNSSVFDSYDKMPHHGSIRREDVQSLKKLLEEQEIEHSSKINILLIHHHPIQHPDLPFEDADLSILQNSAQLMELMTEYNFNFVIHGHKHIPRIEQHMDRYQHPVNVICAGSFSAYLDERWFQGVPNSLHIVEIDSICHKHNVPQGKVRSWYHYSGHGWIVDEPVNSIPHIEYFGNYLTKSQLKDELKSIIENEINSKGSISWEEICKKNIALSFTPRKLLTQVINGLSESLNFKIYSSEGVDDLFLLIKNQRSVVNE
ncbi:metallophosphoesterase [uncultured Vibrio sp.]|uniref:metallophosphoesterase family protein n=1 Tax=uncultured Vibrio sp. TaxID=114054 RepID=UPI0026196580|nr:metallophosphoesterase [uncultured Vibrio sp.]